jgi:hypothetical protein
MGAIETAYWTSWFASFMINITIISVISALMMIFGVFTHSSFLPIFLLLWFYGLSLFGYTIFMSSFFTHPSIASLASTLVFFVSSFAGEVVEGKYVDEENKLLASFCPSIAIQLASRTIVELEKNELGVTNFQGGDGYVHGFRIEYAMTMFGFVFFVLTVLGIYLHTVLHQQKGSGSICTRKSNHKIFSKKDLID